MKFLNLKLYFSTSKKKKKKILENEQAAQLESWKIKVLKYAGQEWKHLNTELLEENKEPQSTNFGNDFLDRKVTATTA